MEMNWSSMRKDQKIVEVSKLAEDGYSASNIADILGAPSRNAVIGLCFRENIKLKGGNGGGSANRDKNSLKKKPTQRKKQKTSEPKTTQGNIHNKPKVATELKVKAEVIAPKKGPTSLLELERLMCRRPLFNDPKGMHPNDMFFCGAPTEEGHSYCKECAPPMYTVRSGSKDAIGRDGEPIGKHLRQPKQKTFAQWRP